MAAFRKKNGSDTWHWHPDCSNWPKFDCKEVRSKPRRGEFFRQCKAKDEQLLKLFHPIR